MFSNLGPLFKTVFRQAEETDTRQAIQREDKKQNRKRKEEEEDHRISIDLWEDKSSVSVEALQSFLVTFIKGETFQSPKENTSSEKKEIITPHDPISPLPEKRDAKNTMQQRAVTAYQTISDKTSSHPSSFEKQTSSPIAEADLIESKEARAIYALIEDLDYLKERGVIEIFIEPADSFVESLRQAVHIEKLRIKKHR